MKCLIIAAGKGSRLRHKGNSKPLVPVLGVPIIERVIRAATQAGIDDFCVVTGYEGEKVRGLLDNLAPRLGVSIAHVINEEWGKENGLSVLKASLCLKDEKFLLLMSDHLFDPSILTRIKDEPLGNNKVVLAVDRNVTENRWVNLDDVTKVKTDGNRISDIGKRIGDYNAFDTGIFLCSPALFEVIENLPADGSKSLSAAIKVLAQRGEAGALDIERSFWIDVDDDCAFRKAERFSLDGLKKPTDGPVSRRLNRPLSTRITKYLLKTNITPNQVSIISFLLSSIGAALFFFGGYTNLVLGGLLAQASSIVDGCDGEIARLKFQATEFGGWFDAVLDRYADAFLLFGLTCHVYLPSHNLIHLLVGFMAIIGSFMYSYTADKYDGYMQSRLRGAGAYFRWGRDVRMFVLFVGALLNLPFAALLLIAIGTNMENIRRVWVLHGRRQD